MCNEIILQLRYLCEQMLYNCYRSSTTRSDRGTSLLRKLASK